jgi:hypothetical protein
MDKEQLFKNTKLSKGDLLIANSQCKWNMTLGLTNLKKVINGMYFTSFNELKKLKKYFGTNKVTPDNSKFY